MPASSLKQGLTMQIVLRTESAPLMRPSTGSEVSTPGPGCERPRPRGLPDRRAMDDTVREMDKATVGARALASTGIMGALSVAQFAVGFGLQVVLARVLAPDVFGQ